MSRREPTLFSSVTLIVASVVIGGVGLLLAPWADSFWHSSHAPLSSQAQRDAGSLAFELSSALLVCGVGGVVWGVRDLVAAPWKRRG